MKTKPTVNDIIWCNGRCGGRANTPACTNICVALWQARVKWMKHQQFVKDMAQKRVDLDPIGSMSAERIFKPDYSKTLKRHPQETDKQFQLRVRIRDAADGRQKRTQSTLKKRQHALMVMRQHYSRRFRMRRRNEVGRALLVLKRFVAMIENGGVALAPTNVRMRAKRRYSSLRANLKFARMATITGDSFDASVNGMDTGMSMSVLDAHRAFAPIGSLDSTTFSMHGCGYRIPAGSASIPIEGLTELHSFNWARYGSWPASRGPRTNQIESPSDKRERGEEFVSAFLEKCTRAGSQAERVILEEETQRAQDSPSTVAPRQHTRTDSDVSVAVQELAQEAPDDDAQIKLGRSMSISQARPFTALGEGAVEQLTPQQQVVILRLYDVLCKGLMISKHASKGRPHTRYLYCNEEMTRLYWRPERVDSADAVLRVSLGFAGKQDSDRECRVADIRDIVDDLSTDVLQRSLVRGYVQPKSNQRGVYAPGFVSLVLLDRTLDFQVGLEEWDTFYHAVKILVNLHQKILPNLKDRR